MALFKKRTGVTQAFRDNKQLQQFVLTGVTPTGKKLGSGSYGSVEEVRYKHLTCAGKRLHEVLIEADNDGVDVVVDRYLQECQLMSSLRHPNITQFLGLCFLPGSQLPLLIMERLEMNLDDLLGHIPNLPISLKRSILEDVAGGLLYLHDRPSPVIHRDLTSSNVLLTSSLVAKITDMGNSRIFNIKGGQIARTLSRIPGTLVYMPPEARDDAHRYGPSLDIFSFGHLALYTLIQKFPCDLLSSTYLNPDNLDEVRGRTELECRGVYIDLLMSHFSSNHPTLVQLIKQCLHNDPQQRPGSEELLATLQGMKVEVEGEYGGSPIRLDMVRVRLAKEVKELTLLQERNEVALKKTKKEVEEKTREVDVKTREVEVKTKEVEEKRRELEEKTKEVEEKRKEVEEKINEIEVTNRHVRELEAEIHIKDECIAAYERETERQEEEKEAKNQITIQVLSAQIEDIEGEINRLKETINSHEKQWMSSVRSGLIDAERAFDTQQDLMETLKEPDDPTSLTLLPTQSSFIWKRDADLPIGSSGSKGMLLEEKLYIGGGDCKDMTSQQIVYEYDINGVVRKWTALPAVPVVYFAMEGVCQMLTLIGGMDIGNKMATNSISTWDRDMQRWVTSTLPPMQTARQDCSTTVHKQWLLVAGGMNYKKPIYNVELFNMNSSQWHMARPLPKPSVGMTCCVINNIWYLLGGTNFTEPVKGESGPKEYVFSLTLNENIATNKWNVLPDTPLYCCSAVPFGDYLMAIGGTDSLTSCTYNPSMFLYSIANEKWMYVGNMPSARSQVTCVVLSKGRLAVLGGQERGSKYSQAVEILHC